MAAGKVAHVNDGETAVVIGAAGSDWIALRSIISAGHIMNVASRPSKIDTV
ncbi:MAG: hypothetical protein M3228_02165 [Actinomycetota bacterium]|nr:hypothetical protein [Actinomycetota bacterium]